MKNLNRANTATRSLRLMRHQRRDGAVIFLVLILLVAMFATAVFAVDYGYLLVVRSELQRAADNAALAAVQDLIPDSDQNQDTAAARETVRAYAAINLGDEDFQIAESDIQIGRFDPATVYTNFTILDSGVFDTVSVTLRRDDLSNTSVSLHLARLLGIDSAIVSATSTAVLQKAQFLLDGSDILPIAIPEETWDRQEIGDEWTIYGEGRLVDDGGSEVPGNWGTLDIGSTSNSSADITDQILNGLSQQDLDHLANDGTIPTNTHIDSDVAIWLNGDTGLSAGMKDAVIQSHGKTKLIPIYGELNEQSNGGNLDFYVVKWGVVEIVDSYWQGNHRTYIRIRKSYTYDGDLRPNDDLGNTVDVIDAAYTMPVLVQ